MKAVLCPVFVICLSAGLLMAVWRWGFMKIYESLTGAVEAFLRRMMHGPTPQSRVDYAKIDRLERELGIGPYNPELKTEPAIPIAKSIEALQKVRAYSNADRKDREEFRKMVERKLSGAQQKAALAVFLQNQQAFIEEMAYYSRGGLTCVTCGGPGVHTHSRSIQTCDRDEYTIHTGDGSVVSRSARLLGGPYNGRTWSAPHETLLPEILVNGHVYEQILDPDTGEFLGGYAYSLHRSLYEGMKNVL